MELSDPQLIQALLAGVVRSTRPAAEKYRAISPRPAKAVSRPRCTCGECAQCKEDQRWESIFNAKFADPNYYADRPVRHASSLDWVR